MNRFAERLKRVYTIIQSYCFLVEGRMGAEKFSRKSKMGFADMCLMILRGSKRSLQAAIYTFFDEVKSETDTYSKQAFSERRQYIKPEAFLTLFRSITEDFYADQLESIKAFRGMHVFAIDGTTYNLPNTSDLREIYGVQTSSGAPQTQAKGSCLYDILNDMLIDVQMCPIRTSERKLAIQHLNYLHGLKPKNNLVIFDRGYPSFELIRYFEDHQMNYLMRCNKKEFIRELKVVEGTDTVLNLRDRKIPDTKEKLSTSIRVLQFPLNDGTVETLITNILDDSFTVEDFKYLYHLRWGIEEKYDELKNKMKIEAFSGTTPVAVLQDFYATMFLTNMIAFAEMDCQIQADSESQIPENKYEYRINKSMAIAAVKDSFISLLMEQNPQKQHRALQRLSKRLLASTIPQRPGRNYERRRKHTALKFPQNRKDV